MSVLDCMCHGVLHSNLRYLIQIGLCALEVNRDWWINIMFTT